MKSVSTRLPSSSSTHHCCCLTIHHRTMFSLPHTGTKLDKVFQRSVKTVLQRRLKHFFFSIFFSNDFLNYFLDSSWAFDSSPVLSAGAVLCHCYCHFTQTSDDHRQVKMKWKDSEVALRRASSGALDLERCVSVCHRSTPRSCCSGIPIPTWCA